MGRSCFETTRVSGWRRVPAPPARMMPFMAMMVSASPSERHVEEEVLRQRLALFAFGVVGQHAHHVGAGRHRARREAEAMRGRAAAGLRDAGVALQRGAVELAIC